MTRPAQAPRKERERTESRSIHKAIALLAIAASIAYANSLATRMHLDDQLIANFVKVNGLGEAVATMPVRPLTAVTLYLNYRVDGLQVFGYHLTNVAIHLGAALALFGLIRRTLLLPRWQGRFAASATWLAFAAALSWMVHPLQTMAVTYLIQRSESMMGLFFLLTLYGVLRGSQSPHPRRWYAAAWCSCVLGAGSKEVMIALVPILLAYDRMFLASSWAEITRRRGGFYLTLAFIWVLPITTALPGLFRSGPATSFGFGNPHLRPVDYWMTEAWVLLYYLTLVFIPSPLCFRYLDWPLTTTFSAFLPAGLVIGPMLLGSGWLCLRRHWVGFAGLWFFGILSITSLVPLRDVANEYRLYLPLAALSLLVVLAGYHGLTLLSSPRDARIVGFLLLGAAAVGLSWLTVRRNEDYRSVRQLWASIEALYPENRDVLTAIGNDHEAADKLDRALAYYEKTLRKHPYDEAAKFHLGRLLCRQDRAAQGIKLQLSCMEFVDGEPVNHTIVNVVAYANFEVGRSLFILDRRNEARDRFEKAVQLNPFVAEYHSALALVLREAKEFEASHDAYQRALSLDKDWPKKARQLAEKFLHRYPLHNAWTRKEALFCAEQAAQASDFEDAAAIDVLLEAYAANGMFEQAAQLACTLNLAGERKAEFRRIIRYCRRR